MGLSPTPRAVSPTRSPPSPGRTLQEDETNSSDTDPGAGAGGNVGAGADADEEARLPLLGRDVQPPLAPEVNAEHERARLLLRRDCV